MARKESAGRMKAVLALSLLFGPAIFLIIIALVGARSCEHKFKVPEDYGQLYDYSFTDARGKKFTSKDFKDNVVLINILQLKCPDSCSISFWHVDQHIFQNVRSSKKKLGSVRIISFVTDGKGNPVEDVQLVADMMKDRVAGYDPDMWYVASGDSRPIYDMQNNNQTLLQTGDDKFGGEGYQQLMLLADKDNHLRMVLPGDSEGMVRRMKEHVALLQKVYDKAQKEERRGK
ncbi:MAG: SCO family protein [Crocinitomicaceae bacterium]|nr:SCO family protein [Flavobacteriales bacterium]NQZ35723.1 SCO family protein [Crocinitomicaceae bacterium]